MPAVTTAQAVPATDIQAAQYNALRSEMLTSRHIGLIEIWTTGSAPEDFLLCQGQAVSRTTYASLFAVIGTTYGVGNGTTTFNLPDFRDRNAVGSSGTKSLGSTGGASTINIAHTHSVSLYTSPPDEYYNVQSPPESLGVGTRNHVHLVAGNTASSLSSSQSVQDPYTTVNYIIRYQ